MANNSPIKITELRGVLDNLIKDTRDLVLKLSKKRPDYVLTAYQAEFHVRGLVRHYKNIVLYYTRFAREVSRRAELDADVIWVSSPHFQIILFELYALVNLAKITLDNLRQYLAPVFSTSFHNLPKSVSDFLEYDTDCPVYVWMKQQPEINYLIDFRNCLVHFRSFATSDNALILKEGVTMSDILGEDHSFFEPMAKGVFRQVDSTGIAINVYLPDRIFIRDDKGKRLANFTYEEKFNLVSQARVFACTTIISVLFSLELVFKEEQPKFKYEKKKSSNKLPSTVD